MSPNPDEKPEDLDSQITGKRQQIAVLQRELRELEKRQRALKRQPAVEVPLPASTLVNQPVEESNSNSSASSRLLLTGIAFLLAGLGQWALHVPLRIGSWAINGWIFYAASLIFFLIAFHRIRLGHFSQRDLDNRSNDDFHPSPIFWVLLILSILVLWGSLIL